MAASPDRVPGGGVFEPAIREQPTATRRLLDHAAGFVIVASGAAATEVAGAAYALPVPRAPLPLLAPLLSVVHGRPIVAALARTKGLDTDSPVGLSKVTVAH